MGIVVVGVDGSEGAGFALDYAIKEAVAHGYLLRIVSAWEIPPSVLANVVAGTAFYEEFEKSALEVAREAAAHVAEVAPEVQHEVVVDEGQAGKVILAHAEDADLLVVGRKGYGTFREMLLGSVSRQLTVHAKCPLLIVPTAEQLVADKNGE